MSVNLKASPFYLNDSQVEFVEKTIGSMKIEEKIGQLFFLMVADTNEDFLSYLMSIKPGGAMLRPMHQAEVFDTHSFMETKSNLPMFFAANLEAGADGLIEEGTCVGHSLLVAATNDPNMAYRQGEVCIKEAKALGGNMAFAPILDLNFNWENPIANIRSFGDDVEKVSAMTRQYVNAVQDHGGSVTIKHFPGDGVDGRDQHVLKTINSLDFNTWRNTFGKVYQDNIDNHATGLMVGHIALPGYFENKCVESKDKMAPASLSKHLLTDLLRDEMGFNGLVMTDATLMAGFGAEGKRCDLLPQAIAAGNDMLLFTRDLHEDYGYVMQGYKTGIITDERLNDALMRIIGLKVKQNLFEDNVSKIDAADFTLIGCEQHKHYARQAADLGVTLIKDEQGLLPLDKNKVKRVGVISLGNEIPMSEVFSPSRNFVPAHTKFKDCLEKEGFVVEFIDHSNPEHVQKSFRTSTKDFIDSYDLIIYFVKKDTKSNQTNLRLEFKSPFGFDAPWFIHEVPTMFVSVGNPYHQYDLEQVMTGVNGYSPTNEVLAAIVDKLLGNTGFVGVSPVKLDTPDGSTRIAKALKKVAL